jgi:hypothetical protein
MTRPTTTYILAEERRVTLDANGEGWIDGVGPTQYGEEWHISATQCVVDNSVAESRLKVFINGKTRVVDSTYSGNQDNSDTTFHLRSGEKLYYQFTHGTAGASAAIILSGERIVLGRRGYAV